MEPRRRAPRVTTEQWLGRCAFDDAAEPPQWMECQVVDVSVFGAGVVLWTESDDELIGRTVVVEVSPPIGESLQLQLIGRVRWAARESSYHVRVGLEFENLSQIEESIVRLVEQLQGEQ